MQAESGVAGIQGQTGVVGVKGDSGVAGGEEEGEKHELLEEESYESDNMLSNSELKDDEDASKSIIGVRGRGKRFRFEEGLESPRMISFLGIRGWDVGGSGN